MASSKSAGMAGRPPKGMTAKAAPGSMKALGRTIKKYFSYYPVMAPLTMLCMIFSSAVAAIPSLFVERVLSVVETWYRTKDWAAARPDILRYLLILVILYVLSIVSTVIYTQLMAVMTQGFLNKLRQELFSGMQDLPIRFFDSHQHGDIMSHYTNDIDTLRQLVSQAFPSLLQAGTIALSVFAIMLYFSVWLTLVLLVGVVFMVFVAKKIGGGSAKFFMRQQKSVGAEEGFVQEMMTGQKVVKVFCHEDEAIRDFDRLNDELCENSFKAHAYANVLGPIFNNIGNILYVTLALAGGVLLLLKVPNLSLSGKAMSISILVPFLNMAKQFTGNVNQVSQQINAIVMAGAGASRVFALVDEKPEEDAGSVTLANVEVAPDGSFIETDRHTGHWAWRRPCEGGAELIPLRGDVRLEHVDFAYEEGKDVLHDVSVYAEPGQKVAFVGATGAGKTTITNLINRFYDIQKGTILYDGIDVRDIRKSDLRRSLGLVLQDTKLFTGTVRENIRYGRLDATDEQCREAAVLAGADDFISRLPDGYDTLLTNNGANLSQGQRQLLAIARAAVADPPVMILDEATSSIDTHTEAVVQRGMDQLMKGRTVFVIAHRLSTVVSSDVIMVLDHGRIIERGNHEKLIADQGVYYQLYTGAFELE